MQAPGRYWTNWTHKLTLHPSFTRIGHAIWAKAHWPSLALLENANYSINVAKCTTLSVFIYISFSIFLISGRPIEWDGLSSNLYFLILHPTAYFLLFNHTGTGTNCQYDFRAKAHTEIELSILLLFSFSFFIIQSQKSFFILVIELLKKKWF